MKTTTNLIFSLLFLLAFNILPAQVPLIGTAQEPAPGDSIAEELLSVGFIFDHLDGLNNGDQFPAFRFWTESGDSFGLASALKTGKPIVIANGSITSNVFMGNLASLNNLYTANKYNALFFVLYTVEAYPFPGVSPYCSCPLPIAAFKKPQPETYNERKAHAKELKTLYGCKAPILLDSPLNEFWHLEQYPASIIVIRPVYKSGRLVGEICYKQYAYQSTDILPYLSDCGLNKPGYVSTDPERLLDKVKIYGRSLELSGSRSVVLIDTQGREVATLSPGLNDLERYPAGVYLLLDRANPRGGFRFVLY